MRAPAFLLTLLLLALTPAPSGADGPDLPTIRRLLRQEAPSERAAALRRLAGCADGRAVTLLLDALDDDHPYVRAAASGVLGTLDEEHQERIGRKLRRLAAARARAIAARTALLWASRAGDDLIRELAGDKASVVRVAAIEALAEQARASSDEALALLQRGLDDPDGLVRAVSIDALVAAGAGGAAGTAGVAGAAEAAGAAEGLAWPRFMADPDERVRLAALEGSVTLPGISRSGDTAAVAVTAGSTDAIWSIRLRAAELSPLVAQRRVLPSLIELLDDPRQRIREAAHAGLVRITGIPFDPDPQAWTAWLEGDGRDFDPGPDAPAAPPPRRHGPGEGATVARPRFLDLPLASRHLAFVLDASGSMAKRGRDGRRRWDVVVSELDGALERLRAQPGRAEVNVICFADGASSIYPQARPLTAARRREIRDFLESTRPAGATALFDGIAAGLADPTVDTLVLLSDGAPSAGLYFTKTDLLREVARRNRFRRARIDVIQIGGDRIARRWRDVLKRISEGSGGRVVRR